MRCLEVSDPGPRTTVEDLGRRLAGRFGVPPGGAFDSLALVAANRLVGNSDDAAGLELTLKGPALSNRGDEPIAWAVVGADFSPEVVRGAHVAAGPTGRNALLAPGETLRFGFARDGARAWLAFAGGIDVAPVLGSRSTCLRAGFGGLDGRPLRPGDLLRLRPGQTGGTHTRWDDPLRAGAGRAAVPLRLLPGPQIELFAARALEIMASSPWRVERDSDRSGVRLSAEDPAVAERLAGVAGIAPEGTTLGAVQVPPAGGAIVLGPERPITGGYAKPALVIQADLGRVALLRPGDHVRFERIDLAAALALAHARAASLPGASA